jgi:alanine racemase
MSGLDPAQLVAAQRVAGWLRPAWVEVDLSAITANVVHIRAAVAPSAVCAIVKADGYGHGAVPVARAALDGGAAYLGVALAEEGHELRQAGIEVPVLVLSEPPAEAMGLVVEDNLTATIYTDDGLAALLEAAALARPSRDTGGRETGGRETGGRETGTWGRPVPVHLKVDTGMHRVGASPEAIVELARQVTAHPALALEGLFTHLAVADEPDDPFTGEQLDRFEGVVRALAAEDIYPSMLHAANSAGALCHPRSRYEMVRPGMAVYGQAPAAALQAAPLIAPLQPALSLKARVSYAKEVGTGESLSYGLHYRLSQRSVVATVPVGYADGVPRRLFMVGGEVLIGGRRRPVAGAVTMDQILVDCGPGSEVTRGDEVVLLGRQGDAEISPWEWAERLGTIAYEVTCGLSPRLPRLYTCR